MEELAISIFGVVLVVLGILLLRREKSLYEDSVTTTAKLYNYYTYRSEHNSTMYTMEVEYTLKDGTIMRTKGQSSSNRIKYPVGTELEIYYSPKKPELFILCGDNTRRYLLYGMIAVGIVLMGLFGYLYVNGLMK
jgi:Protein of unknown function (DUF3592).